MDALPGAATARPVRFSVRSKDPTARLGPRRARLAGLADGRRGSRRRSALLWIAAGWCVLGPGRPGTAAVEFPGPAPGQAAGAVQGARLRLDNRAIAARWQVSEKGFRLLDVSDNLAGAVLDDWGEPFAVTLGDGRVLKASELTILEGPGIEPVPADARATRLADRSAGKRVGMLLASGDGNLQIRWQAVLRDGSNYIRQFITVRAVRREVAVDQVELIDLRHAGAEVAGSVAGSPAVADGFFLAYEHPNAWSQVGGKQTRPGPGQPPERVRCGLSRRTALSPGETLVESSVVGVAPRGQMRRAFLYYLERQRPRPYRPFLHYNSWYDIAWADRKMDEQKCLDAIGAFGRELTRRRGVALDSFVFDDGWDESRSLWKFHAGFPRGFAPLTAAAKRYASHVGVWLSPWGGYGGAKQQRLEYGRRHGLETNRHGFSLAGPKYYRRFREVCAEMIREYDVNYFKFDGVGIGNNAEGADAEYLPDVEGLLRLTRDLRRLRPDVYLSLTTGTWPSPFWLLYGDSTWRNGADCAFHGEGTMRQQWITYRDMITHRMVVRRAPLYPLNSLMVQGICYARLGTATKMGSDLGDLVDEIRMLFASGTQLQELYVTPGMMTPRMWDALAEAAAWSRRNARVLIDVHWIGGDPGQGQPYGYASWSPAKGILAIRNPGPTPARLEVDAQTAFQLPPGGPRRFALRSPWNESPPPQPSMLEAGRPRAFRLAPFETLVLEALPAPKGPLPGDGSGRSQSTDAKVADRPAAR